MGLSVTPTSMTSDETGTVSVMVGNVPVGSSVYIERVYDANGNDQADAGEPVVGSVKVTDGVAPAGAFGAGDLDGAADGSVTVELNGQDSHDLLHLPGNFIYRASISGQSQQAGQLVTPASFAQSITGTVTAGGAPVAGALVLLQSDSGMAGEALTDINGAYTLEVVQPGTYHIFPADLTGGSVSDLSAAQSVTVTAGQNLGSVDLTLPSGLASHQLSGKVADSVSGAGVGGILVEASEADGPYHAQTIAGADGSYALQVPSGQWNVDLIVDADATLNPGLQGYVGSGEAAQSVTVGAADVGCVDFSLTPATTTLSGAVVDTTGLPVAGLPVVARIESSTDPALQGATVMTTTDVDGNYQLPAVASGGWRVAVDETALQLRQLVGTSLGGVVVGSTAVTGQNLTVQGASATFTGTVTLKGNGTPVSGVSYATRQSASGTFESESVTGSDGTFSLPAFAGTWTLAVQPQGGGSALATQDQTIADGQSLPVTFAIPLPAPTLGTDKPSPQAAGQTLTITAQEPGGLGSLLRVPVLHQGPQRHGGEAGPVLLDANAFMDPASAGNYSLGVRVRTPGSTATFEAQKWMSYEVTAGTGPATGATLDAGPASPQSAGTAITLSAAGAGGSGIYEYQFYIKGPSDTVAKSFSLT